MHPAKLAATQHPPPTSTSTPPDQAAALNASIFQRLHPRAYLERFVVEGFRPDGRSFDSWRDVSVNVGSISTANGSALVRVGNTTVVCGVKAEIAEPDLDAEDRGFLVPNIDLPALCSPRFKPGPPSDEAQVLSHRLNEALTATPLLPPTSLCIHPKKAVWALYIDALCINYDGNAFDAALVAVGLALRNTRLPKATYNPQTGRTTCSRTELLPLQLGTLPFAMSFGVFEGTHILSDPSAFEEPLLDDTLTVIMDETGAFVSVVGGGSGFGGGGGYASGGGLGSGGGLESAGEGKGRCEEEDGKDLLSICMSRAKERHAAVFNSIYA